MIVFNKIYFFSPKRDMFSRPNSFKFPCDFLAWVTRKLQELHICRTRFLHSGRSRSKHRQRPYHESFPWWHVDHGAFKNCFYTSNIHCKHLLTHQVFPFNILRFTGIFNWCKPDTSNQRFNHVILHNIKKLWLFRQTIMGTSSRAQRSLHRSSDAAMGASV